MHNIAHEQTLKNIQENPWGHCHGSYDDLLLCCVIDGVFYPDLMEAHPVFAPGPANYRARCDTEEGECSCGEYH